MKDSPNWRPNTEPVLPKLKAAAKLPITWQMSLLYAVCFGGFVAFSTYLPTYLKTIYDFSAHRRRYPHSRFRASPRSSRDRSAASSPTGWVRRSSC